MTRNIDEIVVTNEYFEITLRNGVNGMSCKVLVHPEHTLKEVYECSSCMLGIDYNSSKKIIVEFYNDGEINEKNRELFESLDACDEMMTKNLDIYSSTMFTSLGARSGEIFKKFCVNYRNVFEKGDKYFAKLLYCLNCCDNAEENDGEITLRELGIGPGKEIKFIPVEDCSVCFGFPV